LVLAGQADDQSGLVGGVAAEVLGDLDGLAAAQGQVDDNRVGVETFRLYAGLETAIGDLVLVVLILGQKFFEAVDEDLLGADDEDLVPLFLFEFAQGHAVLFEELDELFAVDGAVVAAGVAVATEPAGGERVEAG